MCVNISMLQRLSVETMMTYTQYVECHVACKKKHDQFHFVELDTTWHFFNIYNKYFLRDVMHHFKIYYNNVYAPVVTNYIEPLRML